MLTESESTWFNTGVNCSTLGSDPKVFLEQLESDGKAPVTQSERAAYWDGYETAEKLDEETPTCIVCGSERVIAGLGKDLWFCENCGFQFKEVQSA